MNTPTQKWHNDDDANEADGVEDHQTGQTIFKCIIQMIRTDIRSVVDTDSTKDRVHTGRAGEVQVKQATVGLDDAVLAIVKQHGGDNLGFRNVTELIRAARSCARTHKIRCCHADT